MEFEFGGNGEDKEDDKAKSLFNYLFFGIHEKYEKKRKEIKNKPRLEKILKSASLDILEGAETTLFRIVPLFTTTVALYAIHIYNYKLAGKSAILTALIFFADLYRYLHSEK